MEDLMLKLHFVISRTLNSNLFSCSDLRVSDWQRKVGNHLKLVLAGDNTPNIEAIVVGMEDKISSIKRGAYVDIEFNITACNGQVELKIRKIKVLERKL